MILGHPVIATAGTAIVAILTTATTSSSGISAQAIITAVTVIGLLGTAATVVAGSFRTTNNKTTLANLQASAAAWKSKSETQDGEIAELQRHANEKDQKISELQGQVGVLQDLATGRSAIEALVGVVHDSVEKTELRVSEILSQTGETRAEVRAMHDMLVSQPEKS